MPEEITKPKKGLRFVEVEIKNLTEQQFADLSEINEDIKWFKDCEQFKELPRPFEPSYSICYRNDEPVGYIYFYQPSKHKSGEKLVTNLTFVKESERGKGLAEKMSSHLLGVATRLGVPMLRLAQGIKMRDVGRSMKKKMGAHPKGFNFRNYYDETEIHLPLNLEITRKKPNPHRHSTLLRKLLDRARKRLF